MKRSTSETIAKLPVKQEFFSRNKETGDITEYGEIELHAKQKERNSGFLMLWIQNVRPKDIKTKLLIWIIKNMSDKGTLSIKNDDLANRLKCSEKAIRNNKKDLRDEDWIKYELGTIYINPAVIWKGSAKKREETEKIYNGIDRKRKDTDPIDP